LHDLLAGMRILLLEDEFLIAMDVEQLCRDHGAHDVRIVRSLDELADDPDPRPDAAIIDVMLGEGSTLPFARQLYETGVPFVFASGYSDHEEIFQAFPGVSVVGKPYSGDDLVKAVAHAHANPRPSGGG
jgi:DNA-binding NarL/FixJ family response regulator